MTVLDSLFALPAIRKTLWRLWYPFLTRRLRDRNVLLLNYAFETEPPVGLELDPQDETDRYCIQLYHHVISDADLHDREVLEVSCGHGGGAAWIARTHNPRSYTAIDLNAVGIRFCQERHRIPGLRFARGDAQQLPFPNHRFDAVINVEASHCYPDFPGFLTEVARVLRPGGAFLYADFRFSDQVARWKEAIDAAPFTVVRACDLRDPILRGMERNAPKNERLVNACLPRSLQSLGRDFAGLPGSRVYEALRSGAMEYRSWHFRRPEHA